VGVALPRNKHFEPVFATYLLRALEEAVSLGLHSYLLCAVVPRVVKEGHRLSESDEKRHFPVILLTFDISDAFTDVVQILRRLNDVFDQVRSLQEVVSTPFFPKVEEVVLEKLHVSHQLHILSLDLGHLFVQNLSVGLQSLF